jgi:hypothetical protein
LHNKKYFKAAVSIATSGGFEKSLATKKNELKDVYAVMAKNLRRIELNVDRSKEEILNQTQTSFNDHTPNPS